MTAVASLFSDDRFLAIDQLHAATALYTQQPIVDSLLDRLDWPHGDRKLVDPSCGDGIFLERALSRLLRQGHPDIASVLEGWELHPRAAADARERLVATLLQHGWLEPAARRVAEAIVINRDFLTEGPNQPTYDVIAGNPPYLRAANVPALLRDEYESVVPPFARADLLHSFLERCARVLKADGRIALVTSDRWLMNSNASRLRAEIGREFGIGHLARLDCSTAFYRPKNRRAGTPPRIHPVEVILHRGSGKPLGETAIYPDVDDDDSATGVPLLADVARIRLAPWIGTEGVFLVDAETAQGLPPDVLVPAVDTDDIDGDSIRQPKRFAIRTSVIEPSAKVMEHLRLQTPRLCARARRNPMWLPPESWGDLPATAPSLLIPRIAKELRIAWLPAGVLPVNHNLSIVQASDVELERIARALLSEQSQAWIRSRAHRLENGYFSITPTLLRQLPLHL